MLPRFLVRVRHELCPQRRHNCVAPKVQKKYLILIHLWLVLRIYLNSISYFQREVSN